MQRGILVLRLHYSNQFLWCYESLLASGHIFQCEFALSNLRLTSKSHKRHLLCISICHLLLHLYAIRINLCADTSLATLAQNRQTICTLLLTEVDEEKLRSVHGFLWIEIETAKHIIDAVCSERYAYTTKSWQSKDTCKIVVATTTCD